MKDTEAITVQYQEVPAVQEKPLLQELVPGWLAAQDVTERSRKVYERNIKPFLLWLEATGRSSTWGDREQGLRQEDILEFKQSLVDAEYKPSTISGYLTAVRRLFSWIEAKRIYPDVARGVKGAKKPKGFRKDALTPEQLKMALDVLDREHLEGLRDYSIFNLMARTALRCIEVSRAQVGDLRQKDGFPVLYVQGKGREEKDELVKLNHKAQQPIMEYLAARRKQGKLEDTSPLFCSHSDRNKDQRLSTRSISRMVKETLRRVGIDNPRLTAHSLRHTTASLARDGGATLEQVRAMMRHTDPRTTMTYFHEKDRLTNAAEDLVEF